MKRPVKEIKLTCDTCGHTHIVSPKAITLLIASLNKELRNKKELLSKALTPMSDVEEDDDENGDDEELDDCEG